MWAPLHWDLLAICALSALGYRGGMASVAVVGGGVIGLSVAWRAARAGWHVTVYAPQQPGSSWVAGGMLAPLSEGWPGEDAVLQFGAAALRLWPEFAGELGAEVITAHATLTVALDDADVRDLHTIADWVATHGHGLQVLNRAQSRELVPGLTRTLRLGLLAENELAVDNRALLAALTKAAAAAGVEFVNAAVPDLAGLREEQIVLAAGAAVASLWPGLPVRPVKGEILRLRARPGAAPVPQAVVRARVHGRPVYLVPRPDGMVVGATQYEAGDTLVTVGGVRDLIADAELLLPGIGDYELAEAGAGSRPVTPDNLPLIGRLDERVIVAAGHGRNGMLTAPITAAAVAAILAGDQLPEAKCADPQRFS